MDAQTLANIMGNTMSLERYQQLLPSYEKMLRLVGANTVNKCAMIAAQVGHESGGLRWNEELASGQAYEWRQDLGNTQAGDGVRFKGHGWIQVTGRHNHTQCSKWAFEQGLVPTADYFVRNPKELGADSYVWIGPTWYLTVSRPGFMAAADRAEIVTCTKMINGGTNGLEDRRQRFNRIVQFGSKLLPSQQNGEQHMAVEKVLPYSRTAVAQDTYYNCGPASVQTIVLSRTNRLVGEWEIGKRLKTDTDGTDWIGQFPAVLNHYAPGADYKHVEMPNDPPTSAQRERLWTDIRNGIDLGFGTVANIVSPPSNRPRASYKSTQSPNYGWRTVYHYIAVMGYAIDNAGVKHVWIADSGFPPFGYWMTFDNLATLIPPKGYACPGKKASNNQEGFLMALSDAEQKELKNKIDRIHFELTYQFEDRDGNQAVQFKDTLVGYALEIHKQMEALTELLGRVEKALAKAE